MIKKSAIYIAILIILILTGCPEISDTEFSYDPDPVDPSVILPDPAEDLYIVANIDHTIYAIDSSNMSYTELVSDASIDENFSDIRLSPNKTYLLYANNNKDLILFNIETSETTVVASNIASNESEFIDDTRLFYTVGGSVYFYTINYGISHIFLQHETGKCNHRAQLSPSHNRVAFKNQNVTTNIGFHTWSSVTPVDVSVSFNVILQYDTIALHNSFYYCWRDDDRVIYKNSPGATTRLYEKDVEPEGIASTNAILQYNNIDISFEKLLISSGRNNLLIYGRNGLYMLDLQETPAINGFLDVEEIYLSEFETKYAAFGSNSQSFVVGTDNWMGIYNTDGLEKTNVSIENIFGDFGTLYALHCR